ncbi:MAG TPA: patatin-like phospholipase family protein [Casimicrobiaceae bacterium]|nr:patatin-like phospholipase family protein [Casimicrobiaceae bacterium]
MAKRRSEPVRYNRKASRPSLPGQVVLVLQGGGALGAYQAGVYEALHEAGIEPDWVIGTSIGAITGGLICGNGPSQRLDRLKEFWSRVEQHGSADLLRFFTGIANLPSNIATIVNGIPSFFVPSPLAWLNAHAPLGLDHAAYYSTSPLRETLGELVDLKVLNESSTRLTVGAVNVATGEMRYFDSREEPVTLDHIMASGALPPAFPAVRIDGQAYWDGGIYSNTPIEAVLDDNPRRDSVIFAVQIWDPTGSEPESVWQVMGRMKDIQYASRSRSHLARQKQIHHLRHVIRELASKLPESVRQSREAKELAAWGCGTTMHVAWLMAPKLDGEDYLKDIDFTTLGIHSRWQAGYADTKRMLDRAPWEASTGPEDSILIHEDPAQAMPSVAEGVDGFAGQTK